MNCSLSYDLAYVIIENWLLQAGHKAISDGDAAQSEFDFIKIMMVSRTFKHIFLRLFHQNFSFRIKKGVQSLAHFQLIINDGAPLFRDVQVQPTRIYGVVMSKWMFAMLVTNDVVSRWKHQVDHVHLRIRKSAHKFSSLETRLESFLHLMFQDECGELKRSEQPVRDADAEHFHCTVSANMVEDGSFPSELVRVLTKIDLHSNPLAEIPRSVAERTENLKFELSFSQPFDLSLWNSCQWRMVLLYGVQACPNLNSILLLFDYAVVDISQVEQLYSVMTLSVNCHLHIELPLYIANGIYIAFRKFFEILTFLLIWFIDNYLHKMSCVYTIVVSVRLQFIGASQHLFSSRLQKFAQNLNFTVEQKSSGLPGFKFRTFREQRMEVNWTMNIQH
uniref:Uncharacterized protein n=1 Tax=Ditylenchus dipsaci TaxID=166011 RepID=A0A915EQT0_9BILA